jgi:hypothetical protein
MGKSFRRDSRYGLKFKGFKMNINRDVKKKKYNSQPVGSVQTDKFKSITQWEN